MGFSHFTVILAENPVFSPWIMVRFGSLGVTGAVLGFLQGLNIMNRQKVGMWSLHIPPEPQNPSSSSLECTFFPGKWAGNGGKSAIPGLLTNPVVGVGASLVIPDATGPDGATVLLVFVFILLPCVPVADAQTFTISPEPVAFLLLIRHSQPIHGAGVDVVLQEVLLWL